MNQEAKMILFTAPSGAGKTTIVRHLLKTFDELAFSVSATTRSRRPKEIEGRDYYFMSVDEFKSRRRRRKFAEWMEVYEDQYYGTLKSEIKRISDAGQIVIFDIDVKGARKLKQLYGDNCFSIFVKPPSFEILVQRLKDRNTEDDASLKKRIRRMKREMKYAPYFDYHLLNDKLDECLHQAEEIVGSFIKTGNIPTSL